MSKKGLKAKPRRSRDFSIEAKIFDEDFQTIFKIVGKPLVKGMEELSKIFKEKFK